MFTCVETEADEVYYKGILIRMDLSRVIPTNSILPLKAHAFVSFFSSFLVIALLILSIASCSSPSSKTEVPIQTPKEEVSDTAEHSLSADDYIEKAKSVENNESIKLLIKATQAYLNERAPEKSLWLAKKITPMAFSDIQKYQLSLIKSQAFYSLGEYELSYQALLFADDIVKTQNDVYTHSATYFLQLANTQKSLKFPILALSAQMQYFSLNEFASEEDVQAIWLALNGLSPWQSDLLFKRTPPLYKGWKQLLNISHQFAYNSQRFKKALIQWKRQYPTHPAQSIVDSLQAFNESHEYIQAPQNIAVLLPLSGKQKIAGKVLQEGMLAAYEQHQNKILHFIDTSTFDMNTLAQEISSNNIDYIIGPLLKSNVNAFLALTGITTPTLLLNVPENHALASHQSALSMRPEDEAVQAAVTLSEFDFEYPLLLCHDDSVSKRIANKFMDEWLKNTGRSPELSLFQNRTQMQKELKESLDLTQSTQRYRDLRWRVTDTINYEQRNRRDIDMIYIVGSATQTKLLKPYIDVNVSPFAEPIPVFASSRSHSMQLDNDDNRDLNGLTFTEMPWLLNSEQQNQQLAKLSQTLWPTRSDNLQRFFAIGYDSLGLVDKLPQMKKMNYIRHYGQTGVLQLTPEHIITRSLLWGKYENSKAQEIELK